MSARLRRWISFVFFAVVPLSSQGQSPDDILQKMKAAYVAMGSYADTGVVVEQYGATPERHTFSTLLTRNPRHFLLDFHKQSGDRYVIWGDPQAFHTWWKTTAQTYDYPNPNNANAIALSGRNTKDTALKVPTLLYGKVQLGGNFTNYTNVKLDATEPIGGRPCYRLTGSASDTYAASGKEVNIRQMTVWVDKESFLIRQIREVWNGAAGSKDIVTTTYQAQANPAIDEAKFKFTPPAK